MFYQKNTIYLFDSLHISKLFYVLSKHKWRDDRVADRAALEMLCTRNGTEGSNPSLSTSFCKQAMTHFKEN